MSSAWIHEPLTEERLKQVAESLREAAASAHPFRSQLAAAKLEELKAQQLLAVRRAS